MNMLDEALPAFVGPYLATVVGFLLAFVLLAYVLRRHERQSASIAWFLAIVLVPILGVPAYLLFAGRKLAHRARRKPRLRTGGPSTAARGQGLAWEIEAIMEGYGLPPARDGNRARLLGDGESAYQELMSSIQSAERTIHITTFVLGRDRVGRAIIARLAERARCGVEVRLLLDAIGSFGARFATLRPLERAGGQVGIFMPVLPVRRKWSANLRNHRKIALFDDEVAIAGGMNIAREYMGPHAYAKRWIDTTIRLEGPVVCDLARTFAADWEFATSERIPTPCDPAHARSEAQCLQVVPSGPDVAHDALYDAIVAAIYKARRRVWVVTPYFVPDDGLMRALMLQARMGRDVRLILPSRSDHRVADLARARFLRSLHEAGGRIFVHRSRMIHAKHIIVDEALTSAGSANLDMRSFYLNYEIALFGYDDRTVGDAAEWARALLAECEEHVPKEPGVVRRFGEDLCWLAAPLL